MLAFFTQTIVRRRAPMVDDGWGDQTRDWSQAEDVEIVGVNVQPNEQAEDPGVLRTVVTTGWRIQTPPGMDLDLLSTDRVVFDGVECEVVGEVARWHDPITGGIHHVEASIRRWEG